MKIGIITMHRVQNYGSALQAFALVEYLKKLGHEVEIIDYVFPNKYHLKCSMPSWKERIKLKSRELLRSLLLEIFLKRNQKFKSFRREHMSLSAKRYSTISELHNSTFHYDIYITGSDQVWNENKIYDDNSFFCDFAPKGKKIISFGASVTTNTLTVEYKKRLEEQLSKYSAIGVRETSSVPLLRNMQLGNNVEIINTCDPSLLLDASDYDKLAEQSIINITDDFILVHQLEYNFSAEPAISEIINSAKQHYGCGIILIDHMFKKLDAGDRKLCNLGPNEFVWLFKHAKAVVTSSFHGTMFSIIYRKSFVSVAPPKNHSDSRITDTLTGMGLSNRLVHNDGGKYEIDWDETYSADQEKLIHSYINKSKCFLKENI